MHTLTEHIERAIQFHGTQARLAEVIGCSQQQISYLRRAKSITAEMALALHAATGGKVSKHDLRPDIFGPGSQSSVNDNAPTQDGLPKKVGAA